MAVIDINDGNYDQLVSENDIVVIDFWAPWCEPCKNFSKIYESVAEKNTTKNIIFGNINIDVEKNLAEDFAIRSVPMVLIICRGVVVFSESGAMPQGALEELIDQAKHLDLDKINKILKSDEE